MITVAFCHEPIEAHILKGRLEAEGILTVLYNEYYVGIDWSMSIALGGISVQVHPSSEVEARSVLEKVYNGEYEELLAEEVEFSALPTCIYCARVDIDNIMWLSKASLINHFLLGLPLVIPTSRHIYNCKACRKYWIAHDMRPYYLSSYVVVIVLLALTLSLFVLAVGLGVQFIS